MEIRSYELRHGEAVSQAELAGRLDVTQGAISELENSDDVRVSTLRRYLEALVHGSSSLRCSTTTIVGCPCTSARTPQPETGLVDQQSSVAAAA